MSACYFQHSLLILCCGILLGCGPVLDPDALPYQLEKVQELRPHAYPADLDGDGRDELAHIHRPSHISAGINAVWIQTQDGQTIEQVNYEGRILPLHFLDLSGNGRPEILVPYLRNDSLFVGILDETGQKRFGFFLIDGKPRQEPNGMIPWDPFVRQFHVADMDSDGDDELITVVFTGFARLPRGILIHHLPDGKPGGRKIIGAAPGNSYLGDFDGDEKPEVILETFAPNNGAKAGGFDDQHSYIIAFALGDPPTVTWSKSIAEKWSGASLAYNDFDGDGRREFLSIVTSASAEPHQAQLEMIEPSTGRTFRKRTFSEPLRGTLLIDLDRDTRPEIIVLRAQNEIWALDHRFRLTHRRRLPMIASDIRVEPDLDGDGIDEIIVLSPARKRLFLLDPDFRVKATFQLPSGSTIGPQGVLRRGLGEAPHFLVTSHDHTVALRLIPNRLYWFYRYGPPMLWGLGALAAVGGLVRARTLYRRNHFLSRLQATVFSTAEQGMLVINPDGIVVLANANLREALGLDDRAALEETPYQEALAESPDCIAFLRRIQTADPPRPDMCEVVLSPDDSNATYRIIAEPVPQPGHQPPYWLIVCQQSSAAAASIDAKTWAMMAKKVTHDIKTPLTNILLTTQRLQSEYRKHMPDAADTLDPYAERIIDRVHHLRQLTKQFMKILDVDALDRVKTDLATLLQKVAETLEQDLPPTITLKLDIAANLPGVWLDREQIRTALENLISNASHALPEGGTITLSAYLVPELRAAHTQYTPEDYAVIEVQDNGVGIAPEDRTRLFEPGFTTLEFGTGLGLALVHHIVEHHDGFIEVESTSDVGSVFTLHFPIHPPDGNPAK